jgi:hypothetical protein
LEIKKAKIDQKANGLIPNVSLNTCKKKETNIRLRIRGRKSILEN